MSRSILMLMSIALTAVPSVTLAAEALQSHGGIHIGVPAAGVSVEGGAAAGSDSSGASVGGGVGVSADQTSAGVDASASAQAQTQAETSQAEPAQKKESGRGILGWLFGD